jgi:hypothetical protein
MTQRHPRWRARQLVEYAHHNDDERLVQELARLTEERADGSRETHELLYELVAALARMMLTAAGPERDEPVYGLELTDEDNLEIAIDETQPPVRGAVRALLAELNGHPDDARFQVDLALRDPSFTATVEVASHILLWTVGMLQWCDAQGVPRPRWLGSLVN